MGDTGTDPFEGMPREPGHAGDHDILPIFHVEERPPPELPKTIGFTGTGFRVTDDLFVTCWHCVPDADAAYAVAFPEPTGGHRMHALVDVSRDTNGLDLATARIFEPRLPRLLNLEVGLAIAAGGTDVFTWGYPLTEEVRVSPDERTIHLGSRYLSGYVTRAFWYEHPSDGRVPMYELDLPAPRGLSGAPLLREYSQTVIGVIQGTHEVELIEEWRSVNPETGERTLRQSGSCRSHLPISRAALCS